MDNEKTLSLENLITAILENNNRLKKWVMEQIKKYTNTHDNHSNINVLNRLSDNNGNLTYNGTIIQKKIYISQAEYNALIEKEDGFYVPASLTLETATKEIEELKKQNTLLREEIDTLKEIIDSINRVVI